MKAKFLSVALALSAVSLGCVSGCGFEASPEGRVISDDTTALPLRKVTVLADTCLLDTWQQSTLSSASAKAVISEVVLLCLVPQYDGSVAPNDPSAGASIANFITELHADGYQVSLGVAFTDGSGERSDGTQNTALLHDQTWQQNVVKNIVALTGDADAVDFDFEILDDSARDDVTLFITTAANALHAKGKRVALYVPPSTTSPSDVVDGDAYDLASLDGIVDTMRVTTLDYSTAASPGPTIDPGWAIDAMNFNIGQVSRTALDISYPLYGADFGPIGIRGTSYVEAEGTAAENDIAISRGPTGAPNFSYSREDGPHQFWFDDATSTTEALASWDYATLPASTNLFFWGLGAEDPALWDQLASRMR